MNSLKEYDLRTHPPLPSLIDNDIIKNCYRSEEAALLPGTNSSTISAHGDCGENNGDCGVDLKRRMNASAASADPAAVFSEGKAKISSKAFSSAARVAVEVDTTPLVDGGDINKGGQQKQSERHPDAQCNSSNGEAKPPAKAAAAAAAEAAANTAVNAGVNFDAESVQEFGLDLKALGMHGVRRTMSTGDGDGNGGHGSALRERVAPAASATYRRREASVAAVGACLVTSSVRKDGKVNTRIFLSRPFFCAGTRDFIVT